MKIDIAKLVPKNWVIENISQDQFKIFYETKGRGNSPRPLILPKEVNVDPEFMGAIGMYVGDGKLSPDRFHLDFTSKDMDMAKFMLDFFQTRFNFKIHEMRYTLTYKHLDKGFVNKLASYLKIPENLIHLKQSDRHRESCLGIQISSTIFRKIFGDIIHLILQTDFSENILLRRAFLRGLFAAEGNIAINYKENYIVQIQFCLHYDEDVISYFVTRILDVEKVKYHVFKKKENKSMSISMTNWENYYKLWKIGLFKLNHRKGELFLDKVNRTLFFLKVKPDFIQKLLKLSGLSHRQIALKLGIHQGTLCYLNRNVTQYINRNDLIKLAQFNQIPINELRENIIGLRANRATIIDDLSLIESII